LSPEGSQQGWAPADAPQSAARLIAELAEIARAEVGQLVMFPVAPDVFHLACIPKTPPK
jgi:hypothetical protein